MKSVGQATVVVNRPAGVVWEYLCDLARHGEWTGEQVELVEAPATLAAGATFVHRVSISIGRATTSWLSHSRIVEYDATAHLICWESTRSGFLGGAAVSRWRWRITAEEDDRARVVQEAEWQTRFPMSLAAGIAQAPQLGEDLRESLRRFKAAIERR
ncbi:MAG: SRPBCC family protein [Chloroflexi bacterium]|nr:SRPBCC family protein [Chloroflexota bacterium]